MNNHYVGRKGSVIVSPIIAIIMDQKEKNHSTRIGCRVCKKQHLGQVELVSLSLKISAAKLHVPTCYVQHRQKEFSRHCH